ncbi:MAG: ABC transporter ATP-binding protein [Sneathiella sp.]|nr:MAG: ABC transporter ATP-binding protein [Sneathiella sp.]
MTNVVLENLTKTYGQADVAAVDNISLTLKSGALTAILGPSGCGKSTILKMIAGLLAPEAGDIKFDGRSVLNQKPEQRNAVMMFQDHLLFPYMTVAENIGFGLKMQRQSKTEIQTRVGELMELVQLQDLGSRKPDALSGGQQQRVALARALVVKPKILLLDEPLSNLDAHLRIEMRDLIKRLQQEMKITTLFVTHDQEEAVILAEEIALVIDGRLRQSGSAPVFFERPKDETVTRFFGGCNFVDGVARDGHFICPLATFALPADCRTGKGRLTFRPENIRLNADLSAENSFSAILISKTYLGTQTRLHLAAAGIEFEALTNPGEAHNLIDGAELPVQLPKNSLWVLG